METNANQKVVCIANYAYDATDPDVLTIRPGDVLREVQRLPGGWWRGELRGNRGLFPDNFVSVITDAPNTRSTSVQGRCRAEFSYQPANPDELPLAVGDILEVLGEVEEGWWQGRRQGCVGVFPSNFVVMLDQPQPQPAPPLEPAPALPPKPVKEQCCVLFPYTAVNDDELTLSEGDIVNIVSKDAPDRGWWRGELNGRVGLFPDNFVQLIPAVAQETEEKKPDRPPNKTNSIYPVLNMYSEKTASVKELTTSKVSLHKDNTVNKESSTTQTTVTHTNKSESEKIVHSETVTDGALDGQVKKPPVPLKKSPTPTTGVGGLFSGLKSKMLSSNDKDKSNQKSGSSSSSSGEWDRPDGGAASKPSPAPISTPTPNTNTFDHIQRNSILNDPRAGRVKAPRRRPPSQVLRDDVPLELGLSNGHEVPEKVEKLPEKIDRQTPEKADEIRPRTREWEKHKAPWMAELKLNQAKKTSYDGKSRSVSTSSEASGVASKAGGGSTDRLLECGIEEKRSTHSMEMSKSTSSISSKMSVLESFEETTKVRHSLDSKKDSTPPPDLPLIKPTLHSPTAAGRTLTAMLEEVKKPSAPIPPVASTRPETTDKSIKPKTESIKTTVFEKNERIEKLEVADKSIEKSGLVIDRRSAERIQAHTVKVENNESTEALIAQLNNRISSLEKSMDENRLTFTSMMDYMNKRLEEEIAKREDLERKYMILSNSLTQV